MLPEEQEIIKATVMEFTQNELKPLASKIDSDGAIPNHLLEKLASIGLFGILCPQEFGGVGAGVLTTAGAAAELAQGCASTALVLVNHSLTCSLLNEFGNAEQKSKLLPDMASGKKIGAIAISEGISSLDLNSIRTSLTKDDDSYVVSGTKPYVVNGSFADVCIVLARASSDEHQFLIVESGVNGFVQGKSIGILGLRAAGISHLYFDQVSIPHGGALGTAEDTSAILRSAQEVMWLGVGGVALGIAKAALDAATKYANQRTQFGKQIGRFESIQDMISQIYTDVESTSSLLDGVSLLKDNKKSIWKEAATVKVFSTNMATRSAKYALKIHGGYGFIKDYPVERFVRDARTTEIIGDRNEELRAASARTILGYEDKAV